MFRRRRPLLRAAAVGGAAYYAGKKVQEGRDDGAGTPEDELEPGGDLEDEEPTPSAGLSDAAITQLEKLSKLKEQGVLTPAEFDAQKQKILGP
jgi:hypothetical protein